MTGGPGLAFCYIGRRGVLFAELNRRVRIDQMPNDRRLGQERICPVDELPVNDGDPAEVLVHLAEDCGADVLVIGNKGMQRRVLGSVPKSVAQNANCSVLVVKTT